MEDSFVNYLIPYSTEGISNDELNFTIEDYAKYYLVSVPEDMRVLTKDLKMGLEIDKDKVLEK